MTLSPTFPTPVPLDAIPVGGGFLWWDHNSPSAGLFAYLKTASSSTVVRLADGAVQTLSAEVLVVPHPVSFSA